MIFKYVELDLGWVIVYAPTLVDKILAVYPSQTNKQGTLRFVFFML
jgi:hypothetical protein